MTPEEFVAEFKSLKDEIENGYFSNTSDISRIESLKSSGLTDGQIQSVKNIVSEALTDALYTILLGLDGSASIGNEQMMYQLSDEDGNEISGEIESYAWEIFHGENT